MNEMTKGGRDFVGYEYKQVPATGETMSMLINCYQSFGWELDENTLSRSIHREVVLSLKRDRRIVNKAELTRLQRNFEGCLSELTALERSKTTLATTVALCIGILGTAFIAGSVFAVTAQPPKILLCIILAVPGFAGWALPHFVFRKLHARKCAQLAPLIEEKYEEIYQLCEKGMRLVGNSQVD